MVAHQSPRLLITDDDRALRETLGDVLSRRGYSVDLARDGEEGLEILRRGEVHLLLVDLHMPRLTGLEMLSRLRQEGHHAPFILMSAALDEAVRAEAERMRAFRVVPKPLRIAEVDALVRQAMQQVYGWAG